MSKISKAMLDKALREKETKVTESWKPAIDIIERTLISRRMGGLGLTPMDRRFAAEIFEEVTREFMPRGWLNKDKKTPIDLGAIMSGVGAGIVQILLYTEREPFMIKQGKLQIDWGRAREQGNVVSIIKGEVAHKCTVCWNIVHRKISEDGYECSCGGVYKPVVKDT